MKIHTLLKDVKNKATIEQGLSLAFNYLKSIGYNVTNTFSETTKTLYGTPNVYVDSTGQQIKSVIVNPLDAFHAFSGINADLFLLIYNADDVSPRPTNPSTLGKTIQIPEFWYGTFPEVFAQFFLHELCHSKFQEFGKPDLTHNQPTSAYSQKPPIEYYLYLLKELTSNLKPIDNLSATPQPAPVTNVSSTPLPVLKIGSKGEFVVSLQKDLTSLGYPLKADGDFGPKTDKAVKQFQSDNKLTVDGIVGRNTYSKIEELKKKLTNGD